MGGRVVRGGVSGGGGWAARGRLYLLIDCLKFLQVKEMLVKGPDKPRTPT